MPNTAALSGYGTTLEIALLSDPGTLVYIRETTEHTPPSFTDSQIEVTHMGSPNRTKEYIAGLADAGESSHKMNFVPGSPTDIFLLGVTGKDLVINLTFPNGRKMIYRGVRKSYERAVPLDGGMSATVSFKVSGAPAMTDPALPRAIEAPVIEGAATAAVGVPLILDHGTWAGASDWTYQWKADGVDIAGATGASFVPVAGNAGTVLTCKVTGSNDSLSDDVETAGTQAVAA